MIGFRSGTTIGPATIADVDQLLWVREASWRQAYSRILKDRLAIALDPVPRREEWVRRIERGGVFVAKSQESVIGYGSIATICQGQAGIETLYVHPDHQSGGIGADLMVHLLRVARQQRIEELLIGVLVGNDRASNLYQDWGAEPAFEQEHLIAGTNFPEQVFRFRSVDKTLQRILRIDVQSYDPQRHDSREIHQIVRAAYDEWGQQNLRFMGTHQDLAITEERLLEGDSFVLTFRGRAVGTITLYCPHRSEYGNFVYDDGLATFGQLAVEPLLQGLGLGAHLIRHAESVASARGATCMALDTAMGAHRIVAMYQHLGYSTVSTADWSETNYISWIMAKRLPAIQ